ncbi:MAG: hypothetical protein OJF51_001154 [Nitrospira sp.]|jgi:hypothetical protein|nr:MAG: hypothetical protein OJF51_001154 [Nitrospira sp.]
MQQAIRSRIASLKKELEAGQGRAQELERQQMYLRDTLLRISGAIQVLEEVLKESPVEESNGDRTREEPVASS